jgi:hypothetical protein
VEGLVRIVVGIVAADIGVEVPLWIRKLSTASHLSP